MNILLRQDTYTLLNPFRSISGVRAGLDLALPPVNVILKYNF